MKIVLLGANGQLAQDILLLHDKQYRNDIYLIPLLRTDVDVTDLEKLKLILATYDFDVLINCTSFHKTDEAERQHTKAFNTNSYAVAEMAKICEKKAAKFIHISTDYVFGFHEHRRPLLETDIAVPYNIYGASKLMGEGLAQQYCSQTFILRVASLFGTAGSSAKGGNFITTMLKLGKERSILTVVEDQWMSPTSTDEVAKIIFMILAKKLNPGVYHAVNSGFTSWYNFAKEIFYHANYSVQVDPISAANFSANAVRPSYSALDNTKIQHTLHYDIPHWKIALKKWFEKQWQK